MMIFFIHMNGFNKSHRDINKLFFLEVDTGYKD